jgi:aspartyl aminopeptidase
MAEKKAKQSAAKKMEEKLFLKRESSWPGYSPADTKKVFSFADDYKGFMALCKTERQCASFIIAELEKAGYRNIDAVKSTGKRSRVYRNIKNKAVIACMAGSDSARFRIVGSHIDSPRLDLKPSPLYESCELALLQSHYYGGIKKFHWVNVPLALHGVAFTSGGKAVEISIGEKEGDPRFIIPDLLPHLAQEQMKKEAPKIIEGEDLNIIVAHMPVKDDDIKEKIKFALLRHLHDRYGIVEEDFNCAELELVPAVTPMDIGFDRALVGAYGQDDRVCVYASLRAFLDVREPRDNALALFVDKEEIGSTGDTGAESFMLQGFARDFCMKAGIKADPAALLERSLAISADVTGAMDPNFQSVNDPQNVSYLGRGVSIEKYGGARGKSGTHDARAEYMHYLRSLAARQAIPWQTGENGKIDLGGGGTIAMFLSRYGMDCVDAGPCMLGMHSTCEVTSKADIYSAYRLYRAFLEDSGDVIEAPLSRKQ